MLQDIQFKSAQHVIDEVRNMNVKGGSPFGRAAAWAYSLACTQERFAGRADLTARFDDISSQLLALKPTMATIYNTKSLVYKSWIPSRRKRRSTSLHVKSMRSVNASFIILWTLSTDWAKTAPI